MRPPLWPFVILTATNRTPNLRTMLIELVEAVPMDQFLIQHEPSEL